ncbi:hypothetical protein FOCC_FOCC008555 [Frankliniella occidentalis]|nr:hypothetical protein FOCC_FOCC008555 [Frankliniella occidentalis]
MAKEEMNCSAKERLPLDDSVPASWHAPEDVAFLIIYALCAMPLGKNREQAYNTHVLGANKIYPTRANYRKLKFVMDGVLKVDGVVEYNGVLKADGVVIEYDGLLKVDGLVEHDGVLKVDGLVEYDGVLKVDGVVEHDGVLKVDGVVEYDGVLKLCKDDGTFGV